MLDRLGILTTAIASGSEGGAHHAHLSLNGLFIYLGVILAIIMGFLAMAKKGFGKRVFVGAPARLAEHLYLFIENMCVSTIGPHGRRYIPMILTFWLVIFVSNLVALFFPTAPTADLGFNFGMALISIFYVQWEGIRANGFFGHMSHFAGPKLGLALIPINVMIFGIEIVSEMMKNVSLSLRLFGNIDGGHKAAEGISALGHFGDSFFIPLGSFLLPIKLLTVVVQALIFCLLTCVYLSLVTSHDHGDDDHGEAAHDEQGGHLATAH